MALVTLQQAKTHLRIPPDDTANDGDVGMKAAQASAIIVDYLKRWAHQTSTVVSSSVAANTVITTATAHGFSSGHLVTITGHVDSDPDLNDGLFYAATVISTTTFSIPKAVTVAGTGGTATVLWTDLTVPFQVQASVLLMLTHLYEQRGDDMTTDANLWLAIERLLMRSRDPALA